MNSNLEDSDPEPETSTSCALYDCIPPELVTRIDNYLSFEDSFNFQISDDPEECCIISITGRAPRRRYLENNLNMVFSRCNKIEEVVMIVKDIGSLFRCSMERPWQLKDTSLYQADGYLGYLFSRTPPHVVAQLKSVSLHVDILRENLGQLCFPCPTQDLLYSMQHLANSHFDTFIQISFCSTTIRPEDYHLRNMLISGMEMALKNVAKYSAKTDFTVDAAEGYMDMIVEKGNVEYSFAFFYYNPHICELDPEKEPEPESSERMEYTTSGEQLDDDSPVADNKLIGDNGSSSSGTESNALICTGAVNQVHCQGNFPGSGPTYTSVWRGLTTTH